MKKLICCAVITLCLCGVSSTSADTNVVDAVFFTTHSIHESNNADFLKELEDRVAHVTGLMLKNSPSGVIHRNTYIGTPFYKMKAHLVRNQIIDAMAQLDICETRLKEYGLWVPRITKPAVWYSES